MCLNLYHVPKQESKAFSLMDFFIFFVVVGMLCFVILSNLLFIVEENIGVLCIDAQLTTKKLHPFNVLFLAS